MTIINLTTLRGHFFKSKSKKTSHLLKLIFKLKNFKYFNKSNKVKPTQPFKILNTLGKFLGEECPKI